MNESTTTQQAPQQPQNAPAPPPTNTMAVLSLVFAFLFWPLAIAFGHVARKQISRTGESGGGLATAGLVIGYIGMGFVALLMIFAAAGESPDGPLTGSSLPATSAAMSDVSVTECGGSSGPLGLSNVAVKITNSTDRVQSYFVTVSVNDAAGNRLGEANGASNSVAPGQSATAELLGGTTEGAANCTVASVNRIPS
ncbi:MAG: DUF4190 domain-containing protein [Pseudonocardiaceae bacterium]